MSYILYGLYKIIYQTGSIFFLFYASVYLNGFFIPDKFRWKDSKLREDLTVYMSFHIVILIVETFVLTLLTYYFNKWYLREIVKTDKPEGIALWTAIASIVITLGLILISSYANFK